MSVYCVIYDINSPGQKYKAVSDYLMQFAYYKHLESFWLIDTNQSAQTIREKLHSLTDNNDAIFVTRLQREWLSWTYKCADWLNDSKRS